MEVNNKNFCVFILTYGRPANVYTVNSLKKQGYTGKIYLICSDDDNKLKEYQSNYNNVVVFSKEDYKDKFDIGDNFKDNRVVVYARNAIFDIAKKLNIINFIVLDDDYTSFEYTMDENKQYTTKHPKIKNLNKVFNLLIDSAPDSGSGCLNSRVGNLVWYLFLSKTCDSTTLNTSLL